MVAGLHQFGVPNVSVAEVVGEQVAVLVIAHRDATDCKLVRRHSVGRNESARA
jgi:hypothetical protein